MSIFILLTYLWIFLVGAAAGAWLNGLTNEPRRAVLARSWVASKPKREGS